MMTEIASSDTAFFARIVVTLGHFLWQGAAIGLVVFSLSLGLREAPARWRYALFVAALLLMALCPIVTFWFADPLDAASTPAPPGELALSDGSAATSAAGAIGPAGRSMGTVRAAHSPFSAFPGARDRAVRPPSDVSGRFSSATADAGGALAVRRWQWAAPYLAAAYLSGVALLLGRLLVGLDGGRRLRRKALSIDDGELRSAIARQATALGMRIAPAVLYCRDVTVPTVVGLLRPAILLPLSLTTGLSPRQVEAVLTHELAHIRRYDHLVNLLQRVVESLLFFHPVVWWVSQRIRIERENCCDDLVVALGAGRLEYATSLLEIAARGRAARARSRFETVAALHATDGRSALGRRIRRLVDGSSGEPLRLTRGGVAGSALVICLMAVIWQVAAVRTVADANQARTNVKASKPETPAGKEAKPDSPRDVVGRWMTHAMAGDVRQSAALTTESAHLNAEHELRPLEHKKNIRIERSLGSSRAAAVVTRAFQDNAGRDRAFVFWLVNRDGVWLIDKSYIHEPRVIDEQLYGFLAAPDVHWHVTEEDLVGAWRTGPGAPLGVGGVACGSRIQLEKDGRLTLETWDPAGERDVARGTWRLEGDRIVWQQQRQQQVSRVVWMAANHLTLEGTAEKSHSTDYQRDNVESEPAGRAPGGRDGASTANADHADDGLDFLADVVEFRELNLRVTRDRLEQIIARHKLVSRLGQDNDQATYTLYTPRGECVIVMFRDGRCSGIQRMRADRDFGLTWGAAVDGIQAAVELAPVRTSYPARGRIDVRFYLRNATSEQVPMGVWTWRQSAEDTLVVEDDRGALQKVGGAWYSGDVDLIRGPLGPGEVFGPMRTVIGVAPDAGGLKDLKHPLPFTLVAGPGKYRVRFTLWLPQLDRNGEKHWTGTIETGAVDLILAEPTAQDARETDPAATGPIGGELPFAGATTRVDPAQLDAAHADDPLKRILQIDEQRVAERARHTREDTRLLARVGRLLGLAEDESAAMSNLLGSERLGPLNLETIEQVETYLTTAPQDPSARDAAERRRLAFATMVGFTPSDRTAFQRVMERTGQRTLSLLRLDASLSPEELSAARKFREFATSFYVNHESIQDARKISNLTEAESTAVRKLAEKVEQHFQSLLFTLFSC